MSDGDGIELDDDEMAELYERHDDDLMPEDVFKMVMVNKIRKKRVHVELQDAEGDPVQLKDVVQELLNYIKSKLKDEDENQFTGQIMPLMSQSVVSGLGRMVGINQTAFYLADDTARFSIINMMCVAFLMLKFVQQKGLTIHTFEEDISDEEIEELERKTKANQIATLGALAGEDPKAILEELRKRGKITDKDLEDMLKENGDKNAKSDLDSDLTGDDPPKGKPGAN